MPPAAWQGAPLAVLIIVLARYVWQVAGDPFIDSARDLYAAQRMAAGDVLYRDLNYLYGPLPVSVLAWLFRIFGDSPNVARWFDLLTIVAAVALLLHLLNQLAGRLEATLAAAAFVLLCAFAQFLGFRSFSFLLPYTHAATFGFVLTMVTVATLFRSFHANARRWLFLSGVAAGLSTLTKPEMALAGLATLGGGALLRWLVVRPRLSTVAVEAFVGAGGVLIGSIGVGLLICWRAGFAAAWQGCAAGYLMALDPRIRAMKFFADGTGGRYPLREAQKAVEWFCRYCWILLPCALISLRRFQNRWISPLLFIAAAAAGWWLASYNLSVNDWIELWRGVPLATLIIGVACLLIALQPRLDRPRAVWAAKVSIYALASLVLMARMILSPHLTQYGFVLMAAPLTLMIIAGFCILPAGLRRLGGDPACLRGVTAGLLIAVTAKHLQFQTLRVRQQDVPLPGGFVASGDNGRTLQQLAATLAQLAGQGDTLAVAPEGCWLNYVLRLRNPTPDELLNPVGMIRSGGDDAVAARYRRSPPTWFVVNNRGTGVFTLSPFGRGYARGLREMLDQEYVLVRTLGQSITPDDARVYQIYRHRD